MLIAFALVSYFIANISSFNVSQYNHIYVGGIVGHLDINGGSNAFKQTSLKLDNWFSNYEYDVDTNHR